MTTLSISYKYILYMQEVADKLRCACNLSDAFKDEKINRRNLRFIIVNVRQLVSLTPSKKGIVVVDKRILQKVSNACEAIDYDQAEQLNRLIKGALA